MADGELFPLFHHTNTAAVSRIRMAMMIDFLGFMGGWFGLLENGLQGLEGVAQAGAVFC
ncbi:MAG: hypothetical protein ACK49X_08970 [Akkermansiaceae bacterium]